MVESSDDEYAQDGMKGDVGGSDEAGWKEKGSASNSQIQDR